MRVEYLQKIACKIRMTWLIVHDTFRGSYDFEYILPVTGPFTKKRSPRLSDLADTEVRLPNLLICRIAFVFPGPENSSEQSLFHLHRRTYEMVVAFNSVQALLWRIRATLGRCNIASR